MKNFKCTACGSTVYFENSRCLTCKNPLGYDAGRDAILALMTGADGQFYPLAGKAAEAQPVRCCSNVVHGVCNWLAADGARDGLCVACDLNRTIPNLTERGSLEAWRDLERAKKRLVYSLLHFGLPLDGTPWGKGRLTFDFMRKATTGHQDGVITIDIKEANSVERERIRRQFHEPYRSLLGHLRHESGHFYWTILVEAAGKLDEFRRRFGDERQDYGAALARYHNQGAVPDWHTRHVSAYGSAHPWEDWAETWAHYLHMVDTVDTAEASGMEPRSAGFTFGFAWPFKAYNNYRDESFDALNSRWVPLSLALNSLTRSMGHPDFYPFVVPVPAYDKLEFIHRAIRAGAPLSQGRPPNQSPHSLSPGQPAPSTARQ